MGVLRRWSSRSDSDSRRFKVAVNLEVVSSVTVAVTVAVTGCTGWAGAGANPAGVSQCRRTLGKQGASLESLQPQLVGRVRMKKFSRALRWCVTVSRFNESLRTKMR